MINYTLCAPVDSNKQIIEQILNNRGIKDVYEFLNVKEVSQNFDKLNNIEAGVKLYIKHVYNKSKIMLQVDSDVDGLTSAATFINYSNKLFPNFTQNNISFILHDEKSHGLASDKIPDDIKLIVIPDAGSNEYEIHKQFKDRGCDILVIDHHQAPYESKDACVINNQLCDYPNKALSGVGLVYKFCKYIDQLLQVNYADEYLDLVSLGLIADMMDTREYETQLLIQKGLSQIKNPLFIELMRRDGMHFKEGKIPVMGDIAWYVAPILNAVTRVGSMDEKILVFESLLEFMGYDQIPSTKRGCKGMTETRAEQAARVAANVKSRQGKETDKSILYIKKQIQDLNLTSHKILPIRVMDSILVNKNLNGLIANKLSSEYQRPSLVLHRVIKPNGELHWEGSARGYDKSTLKDFQAFCAESGYVEYAQGHPNAFGIGIKDSNLIDFVKYCDEQLYMINGDINYDVDFIWESKTLNGDNIISIANFKYLWGQKVEEPKIVITGVRLSEETINFIGKDGKTLRIDLPGNNGNIIKFHITEEEKAALQPNGETWFATVVATCDVNEWNGNQTPQLKLLELDITKKQKWYF